MREIALRAGNSQPDEQACRGRLALDQRATAAVTQVAPAAGARVEEGAQTVAPDGARRRHHPVVLEERVSDSERAALLRRQDTRRKAERIPAGIDDRGGPAEQFLALDERRHLVAGRRRLLTGARIQHDPRRGRESHHRRQPSRHLSHRVTPHGVTPRD